MKRAQGTALLDMWGLYSGRKRLSCFQAGFANAVYSNLGPLNGTGKGPLKEGHIQLQAFRIQTLQIFTLFAKKVGVGPMMGIGRHAESMGPVP